MAHESDGVGRPPVLDSDLDSDQSACYRSCRPTTRLGARVAVLAARRACVRYATVRIGFRMAACEARKTAACGMSETFHLLNVFNNADSSCLYTLTFSPPPPYVFTWCMFPYVCTVYLDPTLRFCRCVLNKKLFFCLGLIYMRPFDCKKNTSPGVRCGSVH